MTKLKADEHQPERSQFHLLKTAARRVDSGPRRRDGIEKNKMFLTANNY
jgi:hypothetical protein